MRRVTFLPITSTLVILAGAGLDLRIAMAQQDTAVFAAHRAFKASWAKYDADAIGKMLSDDFIWIGRNGVISDKAGMIMAFRERTMTAPDHSEKQRVRVYGTVAVLTEVDFGSNPTTKAPGNTAVTEVWSKKGDGWILVSFQGTAAPVRP